MDMELVVGNAELPLLYRTSKKLQENTFALPIQTSGAPVWGWEEELGSGPEQPQGAGSTPGSLEQGRDVEL